MQEHDNHDLLEFLALHCNVNALGAGWPASLRDVLDRLRDQERAARIRHQLGQAIQLDTIDPETFERTVFWGLDTPEEVKAALLEIWQGACDSSQP